MTPVKWYEQIGFMIGLTPFWWQLYAEFEARALYIVIGPLRITIAWPHIGGRT